MLWSRLQVERMERVEQIRGGPPLFYFGGKGGFLTQNDLTIGFENHQLQARDTLQFVVPTGTPHSLLLQIPVFETRNASSN